MAWLAVGVVGGGEASTTAQSATGGRSRRHATLKRPCHTVMTHKYRGSIVVLSISKSVEPNEEQKEMRSGFQ